MVVKIIPPAKTIDTVQWITADGNIKTTIEPHAWFSKSDTIKYEDGDYKVVTKISPQVTVPVKK